MPSYQAIKYRLQVSLLEIGGLKIINLHHENNAYLLKLVWTFAYSNKLVFVFES